VAPFLVLSSARETKVFQKLIYFFGLPPSSGTPLDFITYITFDFSFHELREASSFG